MNAYIIKFWVGTGYKRTWLIMAEDIYEALNIAKRNFRQPRPGGWLATRLEEKEIYLVSSLDIQ